MSVALVAIRSSVVFIKELMTYQSIISGVHFLQKNFFPEYTISNLLILRFFFLYFTILQAVASLRVGSAMRHELRSLEQALYVVHYYSAIVKLLLDCRF